MTLVEYLDRVTAAVGKHGPEIMALALMRGMFGPGEFRIGFSLPDEECFITVDELKQNYPGLAFDAVLSKYRERLALAAEKGKKLWEARRE